MIFILFLCMSLSLYASNNQENIHSVLEKPRLTRSSNIPENYEPIDISKIPDVDLIKSRSSLFEERMSKSSDELDWPAYEGKCNELHNQKIASLLGEQRGKFITKKPER